MALTLQQQGALGVAIGSAFWGLFWIPLRFMEQAGLPSLLAVALVMGVALICAGVVSAYKHNLSELANPTAWIVGCSMGTASVLYFYGVMTSDVIRVIFLFYLLPVWTTIAARIIYSEPIGLARIIVMAFALIGLWLLLGGEKHIPLPKNAGDWCGLAAGMGWGISLALIKGRSWASPSINCLCCFISGCLIALIANFVVADQPFASLPVLTSNAALLFTVVGFGALILMPSMVLQIWGAGILPAPTAALLTMTEIIVATISAYWLIGTELKGASAFGALIILTAVLADIYLKRSDTTPEISYPD